MLSNKNLFNGLYYHDSLFDLAWQHARIRCEHNPDLIAIPDIESGFPILMTKQEHERFLRLWEECKPKPLPNNPDMSKLIIYGTGGDMEKENFNDLFYNPENSKTK